MKKTAILLSVVIAVSLFTIGAQKKEIAQSAAKEEHAVFTPSDLKWVDGPPGLPAGAKMAVLSGDPGKKGMFTVRLQAPAGYRVMPHTHPTSEYITVISGTFNVGMGEKFDEAGGKEVPTGGYVVLPAGMAHYAWSTGEGVIQISSMGPFQIKYVNPADDPRNAKKG